MIRYALHCDKGHEFEGWFSSSGEYDRQNGMGLVDCPNCRSTKVSKSLMAPAVATSRKRESQPVETREIVERAPEVAMSGLSPAKRDMLRQMRDLREKILADADDVGERFPEEARKMHFGESARRGIYGKASLEEAASLAEEGIEFLPLPDLPDDQN